jgi:hypothetical protein
MGFDLLSIHPKHKASSTASWYFILSIFEAFFEYMIQIEGLVLWNS